ncbi:MAG TPA: transglutaminase family protein [Nocardioidaceae bacterium]|nr:transglutaminase family protein [Nocardioidaceae bacterium]
MQFRVVHTTRISYDRGVAASYNLARMTPVTSASQVVVHTRLDVSPTPWSQSYRDYWGTEVTAFEVLDQHSELTVTASSTVQVNRPAPAPGDLTWDRLLAPAVQERHCEYLVTDDRVRPDEELSGLVDALAARSTGPSDFARAVCRLVYAEMKYRRGTTKVHGHANDAWAARTGVCQDMAHVALGALRTAKVPARYVSGYLHPQRDPRLGDTVVGESHAWIEWWDGDWVGFDPTNDIEPGDRHIVVARGRDYSDVPPLRGIFSGGSTSSMKVNVQVTRLA